MSQDNHADSHGHVNQNLDLHNGHGHDDHGPQSFWTKYVFSTDHKVIGIQFMFASLLFVIVGGLLALGVRYELAWPGQNVPHDSLLPGSMTGLAPENNVSLWKEGGRLKINMEQKIGQRTIPAGSYATFDGFDGGLKVSIPVGTILKGKAYPLATPIDAVIDDPSTVMGDYRTEGVRAVIGTTLREEGRDESAAPLIIAAGPAYQSGGPDPVILPIRRDATKVKLTVVSSPNAEGKYEMVEPVTLTLAPTAANVFYEKQTLKPEAYNQLFTMHASVMIFFVIIPMLVGAFGNFLVPLMIGARDMAFPKLNMLSFWLAMPAGIVMIVSFWTVDGPAGGGWTMYPPLSSARFSGNLGTTLWIGGVALVGFSSIVGSLNYITTTINMRAPGMTLVRMPLTVWSILITSILALLATPVLTAAMIMLLLDRTIGTQFFADSILTGANSQVAGGGQPIMWQHLFWFYSHPAVYIMILPAMGVTSDILSTFARKPIFGYKPMVAAIAGIAFLGFIVWGHHMFQSGMNPVLGTTFMASTIMIAVPSAIKTFNWLGTLWGGNIKYTPSMLFALGFVSMFVIGGLSGIFMAAAPVDIHIHDTYFIVAHIHYVLFGGSMMGIFAGVYHWFPKMFGRQLNQRWGVIHFILTLIAFNGTFFLMHILGIGGHPRRYATILRYDTLEHLQGMNVFMTICAMMLGTAQLPFFYNVFVSLPRKLGRAMTAIFVIGLFAPMVAGLSVWAAKNGLGWVPGKQLTVLKDVVSTTSAQTMMIDGKEVSTIWHYKGWAQALGILGLTTTLLGLLVLLLRGLPRGGKIAIAIVLGWVTYLAIQMMAFGATLFTPSGTLDAEASHTLYLIPRIWEASISVETAKMWHDITVGLGHACLFAAAVVGIVWAVWMLGRQAMGSLVLLAAPVAAFIVAKIFAIMGHELTSLEAVLTAGNIIAYMIGVGVLIALAKLAGAKDLSGPAVLSRAMYVVFIPAFLAPMILKQDTYMAMANWPIIGWFINPETFDARWVLLILSAVPGTLYLLAFKPQDEYGTVADGNPWHACSLDWCATTSPPLGHGNFETIPVVYRGPYEYSSPVTRDDYLPQTLPLLPGEAELQAEGH